MSRKKQENNKTDAVLYLRVSTEEQVDNYSLDTQEDICRKEATRRGLKIVETFREEGKSAKNIEGRPALKKLFGIQQKEQKNFRCSACLSSGSFV